MIWLDKSSGCNRWLVWIGCHMIAATVCIDYISIWWSYCLYIKIYKCLKLIWSYMVCKLNIEKYRQGQTLKKGHPGKVQLWHLLWTSVGVWEDKIWWRKRETGGRGGGWLWSPLPTPFLAKLMRNIGIVNWCRHNFRFAFIVFVFA